MSLVKCIQKQPFGLLLTNFKHIQPVGRQV